MSVLTARIKSGGTLAVLGLLLVAAGIGWLVSSDYGVAWDETYFYGYADAVPYAYSPKAHSSSDFDMENAYGPDAIHKYYGAAYILLAKPVVDTLQSAGSADRMTTWHFVNFLAFLGGVLCLFLLCRRWLSHWASVVATGLFATQPLLWGHAFINPKDIPFMTFFLAAITLGLEMVAPLRSSQPPFGATASPGEVARLNPARRPPRPVLLILLGLALGCATVALAGLRLYRSTEHGSHPWLGLSLLLSSLVVAALTLAALLNPRVTQALYERIALCLLPHPTLPTLLPPKSAARSEIVAALVPGAVLGLASSLRVIGPVAGVLVLVSFLLQHRKRSLLGILVYALIALGLMLATWPYLWSDPLRNFWRVVEISASNPGSLKVLFDGAISRSNALPIEYFPTMLGATLTEPVLALASIGLVVSAIRIVQRRTEWRTFAVVPLWFFGAAGYILLARPHMYDGFRHFLFVLPPLFVLTGMSFELATSHVRGQLPRLALILALIIPGIYGIIETHPYQYAYYNQFVGRMDGAFRRFEVDYWLTCYKETMERFNEKYADLSPTLFVYREDYIAEAYAAPSIIVKDFRSEGHEKQPGDFVLLSSRANEDRYFAEAEPVLVVGKNTATLCVIKELP